MPRTATWTGGNEVTMRPLPSLVTSTSEPVSATREVDAGDADVGGEEVLAQPGPCERVELGRLGAEVIGRGRGGAEDGADRVAVAVQRGGDDVARRFAGELDDPLTEVGLDDRRAGGIERLVERDLLGRHRLRLHDRARAAFRASAVM